MIWGFGNFEAGKKAMAENFTKATDSGRSLDGRFTQGISPSSYRGSMKESGPRGSGPTCSATFHCTNPQKKDLLLLLSDACGPCSRVQKYLQRSIEWLQFCQGAIDRVFFASGNKKQKIDLVLA